MANVTAFAGENYSSGSYSRRLYGTDIQVPGATATIGSVAVETSNVFAVTGLAATVRLAGTLDEAIYSKATADYGAGNFSPEAIGTTASAVVVASGLAATATLGDETSTASAVVSVTGVSASASINSVAGIIEGVGVIFSVTGLSATTKLGAAYSNGLYGRGSHSHPFTIITAAGAGLSVTGVSSTTSIGDEVVTASCAVVVTGLTASAGLGDETTRTVNLIPVTGVSASTFVGSTTDTLIVDVTAGATVSVAGVSATIDSAGLFTVWGDLATSDTTPTTTWTDIAA
jgi:hypothetical protein